VRLLTRAEAAVRVSALYPSAAIAMGDPVTATTYLRWLKEE